MTSEVQCTFFMAIFVLHGMTAGHMTCGHAHGVVVADLTLIWALEVSVLWSCLPVPACSGVGLGLAVCCPPRRDSDSHCNQPFARRFLDVPCLWD
jgi:hypothetical protein